MRTSTALCALFMAAACGGGIGGGGNLSNFTGAAWSDTLTNTINCSGQTYTSTSTGSFTVTAGTTSDLKVATSDGCTLLLNVSGNTASLSSSPQTCTQTINGQSATVTITSASMTTSDGHAGTITEAGSITQGTTTCTFSASGSASR